MKFSEVTTRARILYGCAGLLLFSTVFLVVTVGYLFSVYNTQKRLEVLYTAKIEANKVELSNLKSKLPEAASVTDAQMDKLGELFNSYAAARTPEADGALMLWVQESVPNIDQTTFLNLQNVIVSTRDNWTQRQRELVDIARAYNVNLETQPRGTILGWLGDFERIDPKIIITSGTTEAFRTGVDEPLELFPNTLLPVEGN
jgi:hypothetical protein